MTTPTKGEKVKRLKRAIHEARVMIHDRSYPYQARDRLRAKVATYVEELDQLLGKKSVVESC